MRKQSVLSVVVVFENGEARAMHAGCGVKGQHKCARPSHTIACGGRHSSSAQGPAASACEVRGRHSPTDKFPLTTALCAAACCVYLCVCVQVCAYTLPCWFGLKLLGSSMWRTELWLCHIMIPLSLLVSAAGFYSSVHSLIENIRSHGSGFGPAV